MTKPTPGGAREGAGRPSIYGERKETISVRLTPTVLEYLATLGKGRSEKVEKHIRRTAGFKRWAADRNSGNSSD